MAGTAIKKFNQTSEIIENRYLDFRSLIEKTSKFSGEFSKINLNEIRSRRAGINCIIV